MNGYCEKHKQAYEIKCTPGGWTFECPKCRAEGFYDTYATTQTKMLPVDEWTVSNKTTRINNNE